VKLHWIFIVTISAGALAVLASEPQAGFERLAASQTGIVFTNLLADIRSITNRNFLSGSGVAAGDVDGDGRVDLYFCGLDNNNVLYRNLGNWKFEDITSAAGVACPNQDSTGAAFSDVDGDGDLDLLVTGLGAGLRIFQNDGRGKFTERTAEAGVQGKTGGTSMALADVDGDGDLDLYLVNYRPNTLKDIFDAKFRIEYAGNKPVITQLNGVPTTRPELTNRFILSPNGQVLELGEADRLYLNDGRGKFAHAPFTSGRFLDEDGHRFAEPPFDWGLAVIFYDFTGDLAPDIYVCNDFFSPDRIWVNDGHGNFRAINRTALRSTSVFSMGVDFADINHDGFPDFFVTDMLSREHKKRQLQVGEMSPFFSPVGLIDNRPQKSQNTLQLNRGDGTFAEIGWLAGVQASEWSWGPIFLDVDLDGWEDLIISNGNKYDLQNADIAEGIEQLKKLGKLTHAEVLRLLEQFARLESTKPIYRNRRDLTFEDMSEGWGLGGTEISHGMALADLDNDGDQDLVMNNLGVAAGIYQNRATAPRVAVRLKGIPPNTRGIGAKISLVGGPMPQTQEMISAGRYLSSDDPMRVFAAGTDLVNGRIEVTWRNGQRTIVRDVQPNHLYEADQQANSAKATRVF
jgi:hypothetical protein